MKKDGGSARGIQSIMVGGRLLQAMIDVSKPLTLREIAEKADITPAQAHAYLVSHKRVGMVVQEFDGGPYLLGPLALQLGLGRLRSLPIFCETGTLLKTLSSSLNVMSALTVWTSHGPSVAMVVQALDKRSDVNIRMGTRFSVLNSATGRIFGAFDDPDRIAAHIEKECAQEPTPYYRTDVASRQTYEKLVAQIRKEGISTIRGARVPGIDAVAVPIFDETGVFAGAVTCIGHADALDIAVEGASVRAIRAEVNAMSQRLTTLPRSA